MSVIDKTSKEFIQAVDMIRRRAVSLFINLKDKLTPVQLQQLISTEIEQIIMNELGFIKEIDKLMLSYPEVLKDIEQFANVNEKTLQSLFKVNQAEWVATANLEISAIQKEIFNASLTNQWNQKQIIANLKNGVHSSLSEGQINTLVDTSLSTFERNVTTAMMEELPKDTKYYYAGPLDDKTRDICNEMIGVGELTKDEIISNFGSVVLDVGGGFNCRHGWVPA